MTVTNQVPAELSPVYTSSPSGDFNPSDFIKQTITSQILKPITPSSPVTITDANGNNIDEDTIISYIIDCCDEVIKPLSETVVKQLFGKTLCYFDDTTNLSVQNTFAIQSAVKEKLPFPSDKCIYMPANDVIPSCREFISKKCTYDKMFASLAFYAKPDTLGFYFINEDAFNAFKTVFMSQAQNMASAMPSDTNQTVADFANVKLDGLTESIILRNDDGDNNHEYSFARLLISSLMNYVSNASPDQVGVLPFALGELYCPKTVVFVNIDAHSHATPKQVINEWELINKSIQGKVRIYKNSKINKLTSAMRQSQRSAASIARLNQPLKGPARKSRLVKFKSKELSTVEITKRIVAINNKMVNVNRSENCYKSVKMTYQKANRRDPDDFNKQGKSVSMKYRPDIHIYIDTSGSISALNYEDAVKSCIKFARKMNINMYFNSFSHVLSQCTKLKLKDKSTKAIYREFEKVPKVNGGTEFSNVWEYINKSPKRRRELSIMITDFEYSPPNRYIKHPKNLYYLPISKGDWDDIVLYAKNFVKSMMNNDPDIRKHLLF